MAAPLRKRLAFHVLEQEAAVDVDYSLLETIERVFSVGALDVLIPVFSNPEGVQRRLVAEVMVEVLGRVDQKAFPRADVRMAVMTAPFTEYAAIVVQLCAAVSFALKQATAEEFDKIIAGAQALKKKPAPGAENLPADS